MNNENQVLCACERPVTLILKGNEHLKGKCQKCMCKLRVGYFNYYQVPQPLNNYSKGHNKDEKNQTSSQDAAKD